MVESAALLDFTKTIRGSVVNRSFFCVASRVSFLWEDDLFLTTGVHSVVFLGWASAAAADKEEATGKAESEDGSEDMLAVALGSVSMAVASNF